MKTKTKTVPRTDPDKKLVTVHLLRALKYLHKSQSVVVHRDVKPQNIFVAGTANKVFKLGDFDVAIRIPRGEKVTRTPVGTPEYWSEVSQGFFKSILQCPQKHAILYYSHRRTGLAGSVLKICSNIGQLDIF